MTVQCQVNAWYLPKITNRYKLIYMFFMLPKDVSFVHIIIIGLTRLLDHPSYFMSSLLFETDYNRDLTQTVYKLCTTCVLFDVQGNSFTQRAQSSQISIYFLPILSHTYSLKISIKRESYVTDTFVFSVVTLHIHKATICSKQR